MSSRDISFMMNLSSAKGNISIIETIKDQKSKIFAESYIFLSYHRLLNARLNVVCRIINY